MFASYRLGLLTVACLVVGCGTWTHKKETHSQSSPPVQPSVPETSAHPDDNASFKYLAVIREIGRKDNAALFGILPRSGTLQITSVAGPSFLGGYRVGQLDQAAMDHLFTNVSVPMTQAERDNLVAEYGGAQLIYFEKYDGDLCLGPGTPKVTISISTSLGERKRLMTFEFIAIPQSNGDCQFHMISNETRSQG